MGLCFVGIVPTFTWYQILPNILSLILSFLLVWAMFAIVGLLSFWIEDHQTLCETNTFKNNSHEKLATSLAGPEKTEYIGLYSITGCNQAGLLVLETG